MSTHSRFSFILPVGTTLILGCAVVLATDAGLARQNTAPLISIDKTVAPAARTNAAAPVNGSAASRPASNSSVTRALSKLYRIPRTDRAEPPQRAITEHDRMGLQHADAIRNSVSSLPIGDDLRRPPGDGHIVPNSKTGPATREDRVGPYAVGPRNDVAYAGNYYGGVYPAQHRLPDDKRDWVDYRYFDGEPSRYGYGIYNDMYGIGYDPAGEYFRFGFLEGYDRGQWQRESDERVQSVLSHAGTQMSRGLGAFRGGQYREAVKYFKLASEMNQGDPSAMIYAAHALFAVGRYQEGSTYLRKAFTLEPRIAMLTYDMRDDYGQRQDFDNQLTALQAASDAAPRNIDRLIMLGYVLNYSGQPDRAYRVLFKARKIDGNDKVVKLLYESNSPPDPR